MLGLASEALCASTVESTLSILVPRPVTVSLLAVSPAAIFSFRESRSALRSCRAAVVSTFPPSGTETGAGVAFSDLSLSSLSAAV